MPADTEKSLRDLFVHALAGMFHAERAIAGALPRMIERTRHEPLKAALVAHLDETREHIARLEQAFADMALPPSAEPCAAIDGLLNENEKLVEAFAGGPAGDAAIVFAAQGVERYEIAHYATLIAWAKELGLSSPAQRLKSTLDEEFMADDKLTQMAETRDNAEGVVRRAAKAA